MLNSLNNYPGNGNQNGLGTQSQEEPVIQEVYEPEPDDYNYQPQLREVDEVELRNLSAIHEEDTVDTRVYKVSAMFFIAALIGAGIGYACASGSATTADIHRKASIARTIKTTVETKLEGFEKFEKEFSKLESGNFNEAAFNSTLSNYNKFNFMLDISSEVTSEVVLLAGDKEANPIKGLREYSAATMLVTQLLSNHLNETRADAEAIAELQSSGDSKVTYAMQVVPDAIYYLGTEAPRTMYANTAISLYTYKNVIEDDSELERVYNDMVIDNKWSEAAQLRRNYKPENKKEEEELGGAILPNHLIYNAIDRRGNEKQLFSDELILVDRSLLFGKSANAKERYDQRNAQIRKMLTEAKEASQNIVKELDVFIAREE